MNLVLSFIKRGLYNLYYAFYVLSEGLFKVSQSWDPIISITGTISLLLSFSLWTFAWNVILCWTDWNLSTDIYVIIGVLIFGGLYWLTYHYYFPIQRSIAHRFKNDNIYRKVLYGLIAVGLIALVIYASTYSV